MPTTFPIDSLQTLEQKVNYLGHKLDSVSLNTDSFGNNFSSFVTILSIVASIVTVIGLLALFLDISKRNISKKKRKRKSLLTCCVILWSTMQFSRASGDIARTRRHKYQLKGPYADSQP